MLILGIDTAAAPCCAAVYDTEKGQILGSTVINNKLTHSVTLMPVVRDLVRNAELSMENIRDRYRAFRSGKRSRFFHGTSYRHIGGKRARFCIVEALCGSFNA